jgi:hypothetical protein
MRAADSKVTGAGEVSDKLLQDSSLCSFQVARRIIQDLAKENGADAGACT